MDSHTGAELVFDQGLGGIFSIGIAGNIITDDILGSIEYAVAVAGVKLVVLGHTNCGAVAGTCSDVRLGNLTGMLEKSKPAIGRAAPQNGERLVWLDEAAAANVCGSVDAILQQSPEVRRLMEAGAIGLAGAMYNGASGAVKVMSACDRVRNAAPFAERLWQR